MGSMAEDVGINKKTDRFLPSQSLSSLRFLVLVPAQLWAPFIIRGLEGGAPLSFEIMYYSEGISLLLIALFFLASTKDRRLWKTCKRTWLTAAMLCIAPLLILLGSQLPQPTTIIAAAIIGAAARMWFYARSIAVFEQIGMEKGIRYALLSFLVAIALRIPLELLPSFVILPFIASLPFVFVAMVACIENSELSSQAATQNSKPTTINIRSMAPFVLEAILFGAVMGLYRLSASIWQAHAEANLLNLILKIAFLFVLLILLKKKKGFLRTNVQFQIALFFIVAAVTFITFSSAVEGGIVAAAVVVDFARYSIGICLLIVSLILANRYRMPSILALCICWTPYSLAFGSGLAITTHFDIASLYAESYILNLAFLIIAATFVILNAISSAEERLFSIDGVRAQQISQFDFINKQCERVGEDANLTPRELEIMQMICKGRSKKYIAEHFVISENTVRWHAKNLYAKLGTSTRQELLDLIEIK